MSQICGELKYKLRVQVYELRAQIYDSRVQFIRVYTALYGKKHFCQGTVEQRNSLEKTSCCM